MFDNFIATVMSLGKWVFVALFSVIFFIGFIFMVIALVMLTSGERFPVADGRINYSYTLLMLAGFLIWQFFSLRKDFKEPKGIMIIIFIIATTVSFVALFFSLLTYFEITTPYKLLIWFVNLFPSNSLVVAFLNRDFHSNNNFILTLMDSIHLAGLFCGIVMGVLISLFRLGILTAGGALCIAFHNYSNGLTFDLSIFWEVIFEISIPEFWGVVLTIINLLFTISIPELLGKYNIGSGLVKILLNAFRKFANVRKNI